MELKVLTLLLIVTFASLVGVVTYHLWQRHGGNPLQAFGAAGAAGVAVVGIGLTIFTVLTS